MPSFNNGCSSISAVSTIKFEGNDLVIINGGNVIYNAKVLRMWYDNVENWTQSKIDLIPTDIKSYNVDFDFIFIYVEQPIIPPTVTATLSLIVRLYDGATLKAELPIRDMFILNSLNDYTSIEIENNSTGTTLPYKVSVMLAKTKL